MQYVFGLGNPGERFERSRHNAGFLVVDALAKKLELLKWKFEKLLNAELASNAEVKLIKPQGYMNTSGEVVAKVLAWDGMKETRDLELKQVVIIYDDLDLELGSFKVQFGTTPKIHNGVNSIVQVLGTRNFWNVRIGTDSRSGDRSIPPEDYVLLKMNDEERRVLAETVENVVQRLYASIVSSQHPL